MYFGDKAGKTQRYYKHNGPLCYWFKQSGPVWIGCIFDLKADF